MRRTLLVFLFVAASLYAEVLRLEFGGTGMQLQWDEAGPLVVAVISQTPAASAGVQPGDRIVAADYRPIEGVRIDDVMELLRGEPGSILLLRLDRAGEEIELSMERVALSVKMVGCSELRRARGSELTGGDLRRYLGESRSAQLSVDGVALAESDSISQRSGWGYAVTQKEKKENKGEKLQKRKENSDQQQLRKRLYSADGRSQLQDREEQSATPLIGR